MHHISKNWEGVFDFQYKVDLGQCGVGWVILKDVKYASEVILEGSQIIIRI